MDASSSGEVHTQATCRFPNPCGQRRQNWHATKVLHLEYGKLKQRAKAVGVAKGRVVKAKAPAAAPHRAGPAAPPTFVELMAPRPGSAPECRVELEGCRGRMRIEFKGITTAELVALSRMLWDGEP